MKRILLISITLLTFTTALLAQNPAWSKKAAQAVFTLKTFNAEGTLLGSSNGFFISEDGMAVGCFAPFRNAQRAVVIDAQGKEWPVECIMGANDMYDVAKFQVGTRKAAWLPLAKTDAPQGSSVWLLPYAVKKEPACKQGTVSKAELFQGSYSYYTMTISGDEQLSGCPVLNNNGEVLGLLQPSADNQQSTGYAVSVRFATDMKTNGLSMSDPTLKSTAIDKAIPDDYDQALLSLYMSASIMDAAQYMNFINRFIQKYPNAADGYIYRARQYAADGSFASADADMKQAVKVADKKDDAHYQYAQLIYQKELYQSNLPYEGWSMDRALEESQAAYSANPMPVYRQQQAQILYAQQKYAEAFTIYDELTRSELRSADIFFAAAQCKLQQDDKRAALALLDSAVSTFSRPYVKTAAPYLRVRAQLSMDIRRYQQAINDMQDLVALEPNNATIWAEKGSYELRVNLLDQAKESAQECIRLDATNSDGYLITGIVQCIKGDKQLGMENLNKAKEMGNEQAQTFIDKYK